MARLLNSTVNGLNLCSNAVYNTAFGSGSLKDNTAGCGYNTGIGREALFNNTTGIKNTAIGNSSLAGGNYSCRTGLGAGASGNNNWTTSINGGNIYGGSAATGNVNIGSESGQRSYNNSVTIGYKAGKYAYNRSVSIGYYTISGNDDTVVIGSLAGCSNNTVGKQSILIGYTAGCSIGGATNNILVGYNATQQNGYGVGDQTVLGNANNNVYNCVYTEWTDVSDCRDKTNFQPINNLGLNFLRKLNPVKYKWDLRQKYENKCGYEYGIKDGTLKQDNTNYGFLAQEIEFAAKSLGENFDAVTHDTFIDQYSLNYLNLIATLTKALQEINDDLDLIETQLNS
jgi:trimeric autotransporter adhesin